MDKLFIIYLSPRQAKLQSFLRLCSQLHIHGHRYTSAPTEAWNFPPFHCLSIFHGIFVHIREQVPPFYKIMTYQPRPADRRTDRVIGKLHFEKESWGCYYGIPFTIPQSISEKYWCSVMKFNVVYFFLVFITLAVVEVTFYFTEQHFLSPWQYQTTSTVQYSG